MNKIAVRDKEINITTEITTEETMLQLTTKQANQLIGGKEVGYPTNKFNVAPKEDRIAWGITFASKMEKNRFLELKVMEQARLIKDLKTQPRFELIPPDSEHPKPLVYVADFSYYDMTKQDWVVEEVKGFETKEYKIKSRLFKMRYPQYRYVVVR